METDDCCDDDQAWSRQKEGERKKGKDWLPLF